MAGRVAGLLGAAATRPAKRGQTPGQPGQIIASPASARPGSGPAPAPIAESAASASECAAPPDAEPFVPLTPGLLQYRRRPYLIRQDLETGDEIHIPKPVPNGTWKTQTIAHICHEAVDDVYTGVYHWGRTAAPGDQIDRARAV